MNQDRYQGKKIRNKGEKNNLTWYKWVYFSMKSQFLLHCDTRSTDWSSFEISRASLMSFIKLSIASREPSWNNRPIVFHPSLKFIWGAKHPGATVISSPVLPVIPIATSLEKSWRRLRVSNSRSNKLSLEQLVTDARSRIRSTRITDTLLVAVYQNRLICYLYVVIKKQTFLLPSVEFWQNSKLQVPCQLYDWNCRLWRSHLSRSYAVEVDWDCVLADEFELVIPRVDFRM